jgi:hypothetical protein
MTTGPSPPTPEGFVIRTPSPKITASTSLISATASAALFYVPPLMNTSSFLMDYLPFYQFNLVLNQGM